MRLGGYTFVVPDEDMVPSSVGRKLEKAVLGAKADGVVKMDSKAKRDEIM